MRKPNLRELDSDEHDGSKLHVEGLPFVFHICFSICFSSGEEFMKTLFHLSWGIGLRVKVLILHMSYSSFWFNYFFSH